jgi:hypothetical protein
MSALSVPTESGPVSITPTVTPVTPVPASPTLVAESVPSATDRHVYEPGGDLSLMP